jgi:CheY-like chemotaxis protein
VTAANDDLTVLIVDDSTVNRRMLAKFLKAADFVCEEAEDGVMALEKVKQRVSTKSGDSRREYVAILMDFMMPKMDGPTATKEMRKLGYKGAIFGVTGVGLESDIKYFESCGANKVLVKPFELEDFGNALEEFYTSTENSSSSGCFSSASL